MVWDQCRNGKTASEAERGNKGGGGGLWGERI